ncbi:trans-1,2-dihydrobenzene-1,2-diol dehydrogenase-like [Asterias amurensis]|uniref:trans-1,2-dihydrobenzene-1,2-diol dehydrogenase-like n=1 Tax=Asterias amurensis TaxID=7602 RepID=UPI003AB18412
MKLRWGICGSGLIANDFLVGLSTLPPEDHSVVAIAETWTPETAQELAKKFHIDAVYEKFTDVAEDPNIDIVYIAVLNQAHLPLCKLFLTHHKNVLCEKPLGLNKNQSRQIIQLAKDNNVFFMEGWWSRFFPAAASLRDTIADDVIGQVKFMQCTMGFAMSTKDRICRKECGGGAVMDMGVYPLNLALMIFGERPVSYSATGTLGKTGVDEMCVMTLQFPNKGIATLSVSMDTKLPNELNIQGLKGHIKIKNPFWCPTKLEISTYVAEEGSTVFDINEKTEILEFPLMKSSYHQNYPNAVGMRYEAEAVRQCIIKGLKECPIVSHADSLFMAEMVETLRHQMGYYLEGDENVTSNSL